MTHASTHASQNGSTLDNLSLAFAVSYEHPQQELIYRRLAIYRVVDQLNHLGQAIADPTRVRILAALLHAELCVCELVDALEVSQSTLSSHLQVLRQSGLVVTRKEGRWVYYSLAERKAALVDALFSLVENDIRSDHRVLRDVERVKGRLAIREDGRCTLGFGELARTEVLSHART